MFAWCAGDVLVVCLSCFADLVVYWLRFGGVSLM